MDNLTDFAPLRTGSRGGQTGDPLNDPFALAASWNMPVETLPQYLAVCDRAFRLNVENRAVAIKIGPAYARPLDIDNVSQEEASLIYLRNSAGMNGLDRERLQDYMFHWVARTAAAYDLPVQIHTGYLAGNNRMVENASPARLNGFFLQHPETRFATFHGGFPSTGTTAAMGKPAQRLD